MWFDYDGDRVLINVAAHRRKTGWIRKQPPYGLRDPSLPERRVLFVCKVERIATFGKP